MVFLDDAFIAFAAISLTAVVYSAVSTYATKTFGNRARAKDIQDEINRISKLVQEATKSGDEKRQKEAEALQANVPNLLKESMLLNFKPLIFTLPAFFGITWLLRTVFPSFKITLGVYLPIFIQNLDRFPNWRNEFGVTGWFVLSLLFAGLLMQFIIGKIEGWRKAKK